MINTAVSISLAFICATNVLLAQSLKVVKTDFSVLATHQLAALQLLKLGVLVFLI